MSPSSSASAAARIPLLTLQTYRTNPSVFVSQLRKAARTVGFFLLRHDLPAGVAESALDESRTFFSLPEEKKASISYEHTGGTFRGYMRLGCENTAGRMDRREQVEYGTESSMTEGEMSKKRLWPPYERLRGPNPWPPDSVQPTLRPSIERYVEGCMDIASCLREALCLGLGAEKGALDEAFCDPYWQLKLVSYPAAAPECRGDGGEGKGDDEDCDEEEEEASRQGVGAHTDSNFLTLVLQDDAWDVCSGSGGGGGGLQVYSEADNAWINLPPESLGTDVLVCNIGEQAEIVSGGYYRATPHRVVVPPNSTKARTSVPFFYNPDLSVRFDELPLAGQDDSVRQGDDDGSGAGKWRKGKNKMMSTVGENLFKSLARSHPDVFRRYHADLKVLEDGRIVPSAVEKE